MNTTEQQVQELTRSARSAYEDGAPERGNALVSEAVGLLADALGVDATELVELLLTNGLR